MKNLIVVGAGFGGLAAAGLLAKKGYKVTVLEKNDQPGGRARMESYKGFHFDMGPSWYLMPEVFEKYFSEMGSSVGKELELQQLTPSYSAFFGKEKVSVGNREETKQMFESIEKGAGQRLEKYLNYAKYQYETAMKEFIYKEYKHLGDFFTIKLLKEALKLNIFNSLHSYVKKQFKDHRLQKILEYGMVFLGGSPKNTPALYSLMSHVDINQGVFYPKGGLHAVAVTMEKLAKQEGVKFIYNAEVEQIVTEKKVAKAVRYNGKTLSADHIIVNADYAYAQLNLVDKKEQSYKKKYWESRTIAPSAFIIYLGISKEIPLLDHHNLFLADEWEEHFANIFDKPQWPNDPSYYVCNPNKTEKRLAPKGHENLFFLVPVAPGLDDSDAVRKEMRNKIINHFSKTIGIDIHKHIVYERIFAHKEFKNYYNSYKGTALGLTHTMKQTAIFRPKHRDKKIKNLSYTGHYTHPGVGVPMVIISSQILVEELHNEQ